MVVSLSSRLESNKEKEGYRLATTAEPGRTPRPAEMDQSPTSVLDNAPTPALNHSLRCRDHPYTCTECIETAPTPVEEILRCFYTCIELIDMLLRCCLYTCGCTRDVAPTPVMLPLRLWMD